MKSTELRLGNLVLFVGEEIREVNMTMLRLITNSERLNQGIPFEPILLTDEWFLKFGFKSRNGSATLYLTDQIYWNGFLRIEDHYTDECKTVHQLQNLYFALTGVELQLSST